MRLNLGAKVKEMSVRENIQIFYPFDVNVYLGILKDEHGVSTHPTQPGCYIIEKSPFYEPKLIEDHVSVLGFNYVPLPEVMIQSLANHPELVADDVVVIWLIEQELLLDTTIGRIREDLS